MSERAYTLKEIDAMREALMREAFGNKYGGNSPYAWGGQSELEVLKTQTWSVRLEEELRTLMMQGVEPLAVSARSIEQIEQARLRHQKVRLEEEAMRAERLLVREYGPRG